MEKITFLLSGKYILLPLFLSSCGRFVWKTGTARPVQCSLPPFLSLFTNLFPTENVPSGSLILCNPDGSFLALHLDWDGSETSQSSWEIKQAEESARTCRFLKGVLKLV